MWVYLAYPAVIVIAHGLNFNLECHTDGIIFSWVYLWHWIANFSRNNNYTKIKNG